MSEPTTTIYGSSDDLIELNGQLSEEFNALERCSTGALLAFSDGTVLNVVYDDEGVWRITRVKGGRCDYTIVQAPEGDEDNYSDRVTLTGDVHWCVLGEDMVSH